MIAFVRSETRDVPYNKRPEINKLTSKVSWILLHDWDDKIRLLHYCEEYEDPTGTVRVAWIHLEGSLRERKCLYCRFVVPDKYITLYNLLIQ